MDQKVIGSIPGSNPMSVQLSYIVVVQLVTYELMKFIFIVYHPGPVFQIKPRPRVNGLTGAGLLNETLS